MTTQRGVKAVEGGLLPFVLLSLTLLSIFVAAVIGPADRGNVLLSREATEHVVVVGIDDWGWADLDDMPATRQMAQTNVAGNLIVRGTNLHTCASDGWLTLGLANGPPASTLLPSHRAQSRSIRRRAGRPGRTTPTTNRWWRSWGR
ncbi:hypothetical protein [Ornithinimicrobium sp. INDO-MA30-4]|uniref:hypothetical protein n=1 Tax=Ornithinimicrobium sp. INDO-MA30-4 TaxID=2908651 RepID=UPI001F42B3FF|nr:hypothetical protein [Ornithinimicrobium sp. INDO-MA30-4]UJH69824.1 hypothetical protein L0A91_11230 [Ornithinimicrobium sp. INDO-MA30-4]